jgi:hypothetical protein
MKEFIERWYPEFGGAVLASAYFMLRHELSLPPDTVTNLFTAVVSVSAIAVGFLATAQSILFSIEEKRAIRFLKDAGKFGTLISYMMTAVNLSFLLAAASAVGLLINWKAAATWQIGAFTVWTLLLGTAALSYYRVVSIFSAILRSTDDA